MSEKALAKPDEEELLRKQLLKKERKEARLAARTAHLKALVEEIKLEAANKVRLRKYVFRPDEELRELGLSNHQIAIVRQWEVPKKQTAFAVESAAKLVEAQVRGQEAAKAPTINVESMTIRIPEKGTEDLPAAVVIDVEPETK